jgi:hypothetical protein
MDPTTVDSKMLSPVTEDGSMDRRGNPAARAKTGRWKTAILLLGKFHVFTLITLLTFIAVCVKLRNEIFMTQYDTNGILFWSSTKFWPLFVPLNLYFLNLIKTASEFCGHGLIPYRFYKPVDLLDSGSQQFDTRVMVVSEC